MLGLSLRAGGEVFSLLHDYGMIPLATFTGNKRKVEPKEILSCSISHLLIDCMYMYIAWQLFFLVMTNQNFLLFDQDGVLVGHMSFQEKKVICSPATEKLEKHQRLLAIIDLYNSLEQNRVMNNFLCWGLVD